MLAPPSDAFERCVELLPARILMDLHTPGAILVAHALKADPRTAKIPIVGWYSHVEADLRRDAREAGVDEVLPRSAFVKRLAALLTEAPPATS